MPVKVAMTMVVALVLLLPAALAAGEPEGAVGGGLFGERLDVDVVEVEVYVTDRDGHPVTGLGRDDFRLLEDGRPVEITNFYAVAGGRPAPPAGGAVADGSGEEASAGARDAAAPAVDRHLRLAVYVDNLHLEPADRNRVFRDLDELLAERLARGEQVMLVSSNPALVVHTGFTDDGELVASKVRQMAKEGASGGLVVMQKRLLLRQLERALPEEAWSLQGAVETFAETERNETRHALRVLDRFVDSLGGLPGRKAILLVTGGIPATPGQEMLLAYENRFGAGAADWRSQATAYDLSADLDDLARRANAAGVTFYTLDAAGDRGGPAISAESGIEAVAIQTAEYGMVEESNHDEPLQRIALATGGVAILNANRPAIAFEDVARGLDSYYSLGYAAAAADGGRYHKLRVEIDRPGVVVRYRHGYRRRSGEEQAAASTLAALVHGVRANPLRVLVEVGEAKRKKKKVFSVPVLVKIPLGRLTLLADGGARDGQVRVVLATSSSGGEIGVSGDRVVPIRVPDERWEVARRQYWAVELELVLAPGVSRLAVGVVDEVGSESSFVSQDIFVGKS